MLVRVCFVAAFALRANGMVMLSGEAGGSRSGRRLVRNLDVLFDDVVGLGGGLRRDISGTFVVKEACDYQCKLRTVRGRTCLFVSAESDASISVCARMKGSKFDLEARAGGRLKANYENEIELRLMTPDRLLAGFVDTRGRACASIEITEFKNLEREGFVSSTLTLASTPRMDFLRTLDSRRRGLLELGSQVVPVWSTLPERAKLAKIGLYGGVDYTVERIVQDDGEDSFQVLPESILYLRPSYPLVRRLERQWPVAVKESKIRLLLSPSAYNIFAALSATALALTSMGLAAFLAAQLFSFTVVPTMSMKPTLEPGSVLFVEKLSPKLNWLQNAFSAAQTSNYKPGDIILFRPPAELQSIIDKRNGISQQQGIKSRQSNKFSPRADLFVKRVVALPGDRVTIDRQSLTVAVNGRKVKYDPFPQADAVCEDPEVIDDLLRLSRSVQETRSSSSAQADDFIVPVGSVFVLGDCPAVSVDSRIWGLLPIENIEARPLGAVFHLS